MPDPRNQRAQQETDLGWHAISGELLLSALRRCSDGEDADLVYAELWANSERAEEEDDG